ncbi:hypothetical protein B0J14DRAFT_540843 [Halenospora varia]|nr:hypothetical protein B0J14DRAFT_540843 [Halenospora varia]
MTWLATDNYYEAHHHAARKCALGSGQWLLQDAIFQQWLSCETEHADSGVLWAYGAPGTGKSVLCSTTIQYLRRNGDFTPTVYFYCDSQNKSKASLVNICATFLLQILAQVTQVPTTLEDAFQIARRYGRSQISVDDRISELLIRVLEDLPALYMVLDGLDEFFSRDTVTIRRCLGTLPSIHIDSSRNHHDIGNYLQKAVKSLQFSDESLRERAFVMLSKKSDGMFLYAHLGIQTLRSAINIQEMLDALETLPKGIHNFYQMIIDGLAKKPVEHRMLARRILLWISSTLRPLTWPELQDALSWDSKEEKFDQYYAPFKYVVLETCYPLIEHRSHSDTFPLVHHSVWEYLHDVSNGSKITLTATCFLFENASSHLEIAGINLAYLNRAEISGSLSLAQENSPLARYVTDNWGIHLCSASYDVALCDQYSQLYSSEDRRLILLARALMSQAWPFPLQRLLYIQNKIRFWTMRTRGFERPQIDDLIDIQKVLFLLDDYKRSQRSNDDVAETKAISNFERSMIFRELARRYAMAGQLETGIEMFEDQIARIDEKASDVLASKAWLLNSLGILYDQQGKSSKAERVQRQALVVQEQHLPRNHIDIILTINELGRVLRHLGRYEEAENMHRRALSTLQADFPGTDIHITWTQNTLGRVLLQSGRPLEALELHKTAHASEVQTLGADHGYAIWTLSDIARCYHALKMDSEAVEVQEEVVERRVRMLPQQHPDTLWAMNSLGLLHEAASDMHQAISLHERAHKGQVSTLGETHPHTVWSHVTLERLKGPSQDETNRVLS